MMRGERLRASGVAIAVPLLALAALAALAYSGHVRSQRDALGQIGEETFVDPLSTATPSDMAAKIQGILVSIQLPYAMHDQCLPPQTLQTATHIV